MLMRRIYVHGKVGYDLTLDPERRVPEENPSVDGFDVRLLSTADVPLLNSLCAREFPSWASASARIGTSAECGVFGAFERGSGELAAFAGFDEHVFGPTGTAAKHRRRGLGSAVFWPAVKESMRLRPDVPVLIGNANMPFYARAFGCHIRGVVWEMVKNLAADPCISKGKAE
jgi:hypothetical protein